MRRKRLYPGVKEVEVKRIEAQKQAKIEAQTNKEPDFVGGKPNYDKFRGWDAGKVLAYLNID